MTDDDESGIFRFTIRGVPRCIWVQPFVSWSGRCDRGHGWLYRGLVRRDAWRIGRVGFGVLVMPERLPVPLTGKDGTDGPEIHGRVP